MGTKLAHVLFNSSRSIFSRRMALDLLRQVELHSTPHRGGGSDAGLNQGSVHAVEHWKRWGQGS